MEPITLILGSIGTFLGAFSKVNDAWRGMKVLETCENLAYLYAKAYSEKRGYDKERTKSVVKYAQLIARNHYYENRFNYDDWLSGKIDIDLKD
jgi:predicted methyltransferase